MSEDFKESPDRRPTNKRGFMFFKLDSSRVPTTATNERTTVVDRDVRCFDFIPFDDNSTDEFADENRSDIESKKQKRTEQTFNWVPFGENFVNTVPNDNTFVVPQRLPPKLRKKLTPLKITPARRRSSGGSSSSLRRATFRVTPRNRTHLNFLSITTTKKRRSGGPNSPLIRTPKCNPSLIQSSTPSSSVKFCLGVEDIQYISWINVMLAPKKDSDDKCDKIDPNQLILECFNSNKTSLSVCPSKEEMSVETYRESVKWNQLRNAANDLYRSEEVLKINRKIVSDIKKEKFNVRKDRAIHADTGIRKHIMELLLSYNPLWLRIGLETVFQQKIVISCQPIVKTLAKFIAENFLVSKELMSKYGHKTVIHFFKDEHHMSEAKKFILTKFLLLLNFLDKAKQVRLIEHNPCLFRKTSQYKSTLDLIISFGRDYITGVGDITKYLRVSGLSIGYKQTAIEEFDFETNNLAVDLRCGIRLTRIAELMTQNKDLLSKLLFPANNITRKLHNVEIALKAFGDIVPEGITAKDIVSGHRKKTFELLDAIIFKHKTDQILLEEKLFEDSVVFIQRLFRSKRQMKSERERFLKLKYFTTILQKRFRENKVLRLERREELRVIKSVVFIQRLFRSKQQMKSERERFLKLRHFTTLLQKKFRENRALRMKRREQLRVTKSVVFIQRLYRSKRQMKSEREEFLRLKYFTTLCQKTFRENKALKMKRREELRLTKSVVFIQRLFRSKLQMKSEREEFLRLKYFTILCQKTFRQNKAIKIKRKEELRLVKSVVFTQRLFRSKLQMKSERERFLKLKFFTTICQKTFRENRALKMKRREEFRLFKSVVLIQRRFRSKRLMESQRERYLKLKYFTAICQKTFRKNRALKMKRREHFKLIKSVVFTQRLFRSKQQMKSQREEFLKLRFYTIKVQMKFRAKLQMRTEREEFLRLKYFTTICQKTFRENKALKTKRREHLRRTKSVVFIQRLFRSKLQMRTEREEFLRLKYFTTICQKTFRKNRALKMKRREQLRLFKSVVFIQRLYRSKRQMKTEREEFLRLKYFTTICQKTFRKNRALKIKRREELRLVKSVVFTQRLFRLKLQMKSERERFLKLKYFTTICQKTFRENKAFKMKRREEFRLLKSVVVIQRLFRSKLQMKSEREEFLRLKYLTTICQKTFRENRALKMERRGQLRLTKSVVFIQRRFRSKLQMKSERERFLKLKYFTTLCQKTFRENKTLKMKRREELRLVKSVVFIQRLFRSKRQMKSERERFLKLRYYTNVVQMQFRLRLDGIRKRRAAIKIQSLWRGFYTRKRIHEENKKIEIAFKRILTSTSLATEDMYLGNRTQNALQKLLTYDSLLILAHDLQALDRTTKLSPESCETLAEYEAVKILIQILDESNRSEPHKQIIALTVNILLNLAKYDKTLPKLVSNADTIEILFQIIKKFSANAVQISKQNQLISKLFTLLWILLKNQTIYEKVLSDKRKCDTIKQICEHSKKEKNYKKVRPKKSYRFDPFWQIAKRNVYEFDNHFIAIQAIAKRLKIVY